MASTGLDGRVFELAAELLEHRGLLRLKDHEWGIWHRHQLAALDPRKGRTTTVGAIGSACVHLDHIRDELQYLRAFAVFAGVEFPAQVEVGRKGPEVVALLRACATAVG